MLNEVLRMKNKTFYATILFCIVFVGCDRIVEPTNEPYAPVISLHPVAQSVNIGNDIELSVAAHGNPSLSYQWYKDSSSITAAQEAAYKIQSSDLHDAGYYHVVVSNSHGSVKSHVAKIVVNTIPKGLYGMKCIIGGTFVMGDTDFNHTKPLSLVSISSFWIDSTEVIQSEYQRLMGVNPAQFVASDKPVERVTWYDALLYCNARSKDELLDTVYSYDTALGIIGNGCLDLTQLKVSWNTHGYRLPTEAEWEYACRAGKHEKYYWSNTWNEEEAFLYGWVYDSTRGTHSVAAKIANSFGLYDMIGNVWEWCNDRYGSYDEREKKDPTGPTSGIDRVVRGGSWFNDRITSSICRSGYRAIFDPVWQGSNYGFRVVLSKKRGI